MPARSSSDSPLRIDAIDVPGGGTIGLTICPGKRDRRRGWSRDLAVDMAVISAWGAAAMVTLMEDHEFDLLQVRQLPYQALESGMTWFHLPIRDVSIPDHRFHERWGGVSERLLELLQNNGKVLIHCRGGLGRSGMVAALLLIRCGIGPAEAIRQVRSARPGAIETIQQEAYVRGSRPMMPVQCARAAILRE